MSFLANTQTGQKQYLPQGGRGDKKNRLEKYFKFWLRSVAQIITPSGACYNLRNGTQPKQGNLVARDLPPTCSEANTTIIFLYILDKDSHCPYLLLFFYKTKKYLVFYSHNLFFLEMLE